MTQCLQRGEELFQVLDLGFAGQDPIRSAEAIVKSERFASLDDALKSRLFVKLASMGLLKT